MRSSILALLAFVSLVCALSGQQRWVVINDNCQNYPYDNCGSFGGWNLTGSGWNGGYDGLSFGGAKSGYKPFWGMGAALTESSAYLLGKLNSTNPSAFNSLAKSITMFTSLRIPVGTSDFALSEWTFVSNSPDWSMSSFNLGADKYKRPMLNSLLSFRSSNEPITLIFSVWTPPIWLKNGNDWQYANLAQFNNQYYQGVADYWLTFLGNLQYYIESQYHNRVGRIYVAVQNEPFQNVGNNLPGTVLSVNDQIQILKLVAAGLGNVNMGGLPGPKLLVLDHNWDLLSQAEQIYQGAGSSAVAGVAFHAYGGDFNAQQPFHDDNSQAEIHLTEFSGDYTDEPQGTYNWDMGNMIFGSLSLFGQSVTYWNLALDDNAGPLNPQTPGYCTSCNGMFRITNNYSSYLNQPRYLSLGLVSSCIPYGAVRVDVNFTGNLGNQLEVMAFQSNNSPNGVQYCLVVQNNGDSTDFYVEVNGQYLQLYVAAGDVNSLAISV